MKIPTRAHFLGVTTATAVLILCTLLPFLPGPYDPLALPLSMMARVAFSRNRAIGNSARLISDIEQYRATRGHYPPSLLSVNKDYKPGVVGIEKFHYEPSGDAFNLLFEQPASPLGTREFVVYNPRGEQTATSHALDLLEFTPERLERARGYYAGHDVPHTHWRYFWFD